jgi:diacylglycerol kinase
MFHSLRTHQISFKNAFAGLIWAFKSQPNFRIHFILSFVAIMCGFLLHIKAYEMLVIVFTVILGIAAELINTSIEAMTDLITQEWRQNAKIAKDVGAGMMLFVAFGSVLVALIVFVPYLSQL